MKKFGEDKKDGKSLEGKKSGWGGGGDKNELFDSFVIFMPLKCNRLVVRVGDRGREQIGLVAER